ncbi:hypothetical protein GOARA_012_00880 [Gordonia araii NBRC 100433]|uniref:Lipoprotein n=1 Tax=Gordonia araii NBRC 100433 TaxID=1073574 RepID=G7GY63_9ACTN|nr:hypothetical protein [Gordonia araii]NNG98146.1 hypothetical protein [Gordonia araii NBRC 100433]GAB08538.1 hypothetical protein GOARA_012_00880 [Gordonia araii NBRC 100433]
MLRAAVTVCVAVGVTLAVGGCASDDGAQYQAQLSSVQAQESAATENEKFAVETVTADQHINTVRGAARMSEFDAIGARACPGSVLGNRLKKIKAEGKIDSFAYAPKKRTEIIGGYSEANPNQVIVVFRNTDPGSPAQQKAQAIAIRVKLGTDAGKKCVNEMERV